MVTVTCVECGVTVTCVECVGHCDFEFEFGVECDLCRMWCDLCREWW